MHLISDLINQRTDGIEGEQLQPWMSKLPSHISIDIQERMRSQGYKMTLERVLSLIQQEHYRRKRS